MFIDASAVLGILLKEPEEAQLLARLDAAQTPLATSPVAVFEAVTDLTGKAGISIGKAHEIVAEFMSTLRVRSVPITQEIGSRAIRIYGEYGEGHHQAGLSMNDCLAYACAKNYGLPLLYGGGRFSQTDLA
jgi:ribonuclease VapC